MRRLFDEEKRISLKNSKCFSVHLKISANRIGKICFVVEFELISHRGD